MSTWQGPSAGSVARRLYVEVHEPEHVETALPTVVFCHGFGGSARNFRPQVHAFRRIARLVLYDARGHARTQKATVQPGDDRYDLEALVDDLGRVIDEFGGRKVFLTGLSMGAATALSYALSHPERLAGLLIAAYPHPGERLRSWALEFAATIEREGIGRAGAVYVWGESSSFEPSSTSLIRRGFLEHSEVSLTRLLRDCLARLAPIETIATRLSGLRVPTRIVAGGDDVGSIEPSQALARLIPNSCLSVLDGAGHVVNLERVSAFNEELRRLIF